jgi:transcriptional regulator with PAS, ATPase and Fis domain
MENRQDFRWLENHEATVTTLGDSSIVLAARTVDFSKRGIGLVLDVPISSGTLLKIELLDVMLLGQAVYAQAQNDEFRIGVHVEHLLTDISGQPHWPPERHVAADSPGIPKSLRNASFISVSPEMQLIEKLLPKIGASDAPVLIQGETGTGKEVLARSVHALSNRATRNFLKVNCAALPSELVESELFGYERGAFTGAFQKKTGMFEIADGGTIFLDEIGDMDVKLQAKLLQVLQDHEFRRIGGKENIRVDVRVIAATHRDLEAAVEGNSFRQDLYYRLNVLGVYLPPLRERRDDIILLAEYLLKRHTPEDIFTPLLSPALKQAMIKYAWPGNIRELENIIRRLIVLGDQQIISRDLLRRTKTIASTSSDELTALARVVERPGSGHMDRVQQAKTQAESAAILAALNATRWNRKRAAESLGIDYKILLYRMKKLRLDEEPEHVGSDPA